MPDFTFTSPTGQKYTVKGPEGATQDQAFQILQQQIGPQGGGQTQPLSPELQAQPGGKVAPPISQPPPLEQPDLTKPGKLPPGQPYSPSEAFGVQLGERGQALESLRAHVMGTPQEQRSAELASARRQAEIARRGGTGWSGVAADIAMGAPFAMLGGAGLPGMLAGGALQGATMPVPAGQEYWSGLAKGTLRGMGEAAIPGKALGTVGKVLAPELGKEAAYLTSKGTMLTPGETYGGVMQTVEQWMSRRPLLKNFVAGAEKRTIDSYNRTIANQVLEPIGQRIPKNVEMGYDMVDETARRATNYYASALKNANFTPDAQLNSNINQIYARMAPNVLPEMKSVVTSILNPLLAGPIPKGGLGELYKAADSQLGAAMRGYQRGAWNDPAKNLAAKGVDDIRDALRDAFARQNQGTDIAQKLKQADFTWAMLKRYEAAAARRANSGGIVFGADLSQAAKTLAPSKAQYAHGDALMQKLGNAGERLLPRNLSDTDWDKVMKVMTKGATPLAAATGASTLHHYGMLGPEMSLALAAGGAAGGTAAALPYTALGQRAISALSRPGAGRAALGRTLRQAAPYAGIATVPGTQEMLYGGPQE